MKISVVLLFLLIPTAAFAQSYRGMSEADMQKMIQQMEKMQTCVEQVDKNKLKALEQRSRRIEQEVKALCADGKRDQAQKKAISFGEEVVKDPTIKQVRQCGEMMDSIMPTMAFTAEDKPSTSHHVCD